MTILNILEDNLDANLMSTNHISLNRTYFGFSKLLEKEIFVKVFGDKEKFYTELSVNNELNNRILKAIKINSNNMNFYGLVMLDIYPQDVDQHISEKTSFEMGKSLAEFHSQIRSFNKIKQYHKPFFKLFNKINSIKVNKIRAKLLRQYNEFSKYEKDIEKELKQNANIVLHGDVGIRNYKFVNNELCLIDYEKARIGVVYQDFIKLFYQDFKNDRQLINSFLDGYQYEKNTLSSLAKCFLIFDTSVGIMNYTDKIKDNNFRKIGLNMIKDVDVFLFQKKNNY